MRGYGASPVREWRYVLADPELDTFSYRLANEHELAEAVADVTGADVGAVEGWFAEVQGDEVLAERIAAAARRHPGSKVHPPLGRQLARYALVRALVPDLVVECGVKHGLGSVVILRALERNRADGHPAATLIGIDPDPDAAWLVPAGTAGWEHVVARSTDALPDALRGRRVGMLVHDSVPDLAVARAEYQAALGAAAPVLALVGNGGWTPALRELAAELGVGCRSVAEQPADHFYPGATQDLAVVRLADGP